jgi:hypothetical protein
MGDNFDYGENGEFLAISLFAQTSVFDLEIGKISKEILVFICIDVALLLVAFACDGINHQKGGD